MNKIFTYGTLKSSKKDTHYILGNMWSVHGSFPAVILNNSGNKITGQILEVDDIQLRIIDIYEGIPKLYMRKSITATSLSGESLDCWIYEWAGSVEGLEEISLWNA